MSIDLDQSYGSDDCVREIIISLIQSFEPYDWSQTLSLILGMTFGISRMIQMILSEWLGMAYGMGRCDVWKIIELLYSGNYTKGRNKLNKLIFNL